MDRPTTEIILPVSGAKVILFTFLTTFANREINKVALRNIRFDNGEVNSAVTGEFMAEAEDIALKYLVKEIQPVGSEPITENFVEYIGELHHDDGDVIYTEINKLTQSSKLSPEAKKK